MIKTLLKVTLVFDSPWAVGGVPTRDNAVDLPVLIDPRGAEGVPYLPPTSLVGALRRQLGLDAEHWLGPEPRPAGHPKADQPEASRLWALGTRISGNQRRSLVVTTRIDAQRQAAFARSRREEEQVMGTDDQPRTLDWYLMADEVVPAPIIDAIGSWQFFVGRGRSTGLGHASVSHLDVISLDLSVEDDLTWWLTMRQAWLDGADDPRATPQRVSERRAMPGVSYRWTVKEPVAVGTGSPLDRDEDASRATTAPQAMRRGGDGKPVIPGSSWRGVFRHRAEFILAAVGCPDRTKIIEALFGSASDSRSGSQRGRRGLLRFRESTFSSPAGGAAEMVRTHVAIDRITGGAAPGLLFQVEAVAPGAECGLTIEWDGTLDPAFVNLLNHVARDLDDGLIGIGGRVTRGYGTIALTTPLVREPVQADSLNEALRRLHPPGPDELPAAGAAPRQDGTA